MARFDLLAGTYQFEPDFYLTVSRDGGHFVSQATGQGQAELFAESDHEYFSKTVDSQIEFETNSEGRAAKLVLHQDGRDLPATRLDDAFARPIAEALAAANNRIQNQAPAPGSETALRQLISDLSSGSPNYDRMSPKLATAMREQLAQTKYLLNNLGAIQSVSFKEVTPDGSDVYKVKFANGTSECGLALRGDGVISDARLSNIEQ